MTDTERAYVRRTVPAGPVAEHLRGLLELGATRGAIADVAGLHTSGVCKVLRGQSRSLRPGTARRMLAVSIQDVMRRPAPAGFVPAVGARRRISALLALGWRHEDITAAAGGVRSAVVLNQVGDLVGRSTHDALCRAYTALSMTTGPSERTRRRAAAAGYAPPLAWEDAELDRVDADVATTQTSVRSGERRQHVMAELVEDTAWLVRAGAGITQVSARLFISPAGLLRQLERAGETDLIQAMRRNEVSA